MCILYTDLKNFVSAIFGNCPHDLNFAVLFQFNNSKYQNILPMPVSVNSPYCVYNNFFGSICGYNYLPLKSCISMPSLELVLCTSFLW